MKRIICFIIAVIILSISSSASCMSEYVFEYDNKEIIVKGLLKFDEAEYIANSFINDTEEEKADLDRSIICNIFGHNLHTSAAIVREHNVAPYQPKCIEYEYEVTNCTRSSCDYIEKVLVDSTPLYSCH